VTTVLFDGVCNLCNATVRFIIANDPTGHVCFASLQSAAGTRALAAFGRDPADSASIVLIDGGAVYDRSTAALRIARGLRAPWRWVALLEAVPVAVRDPVYDWIARNRYRWFGRRDVCAPPTAGERSRFLDEPS
jgi:predicted DCC family thiol-disulfide oxidoreductase YuxK